MERRLSISVAIITLNRAESLKDTLTSLTRQRRQPDEVVVVDNGSTDHTREVVLSFRDRPNVKYVYEAARGIPHARNAGILNATGDIVACLDDDCIADEHWLKKLEIPFVRDPNIGVVGGVLSGFKVGEGVVEAFYTRNMNLGTRIR